MTHSSLSGCQRSSQIILATDYTDLLTDFSLPGDKLNDRCRTTEGNGKRVALVNKVSSWPVNSDCGDPRWLSQAKSSSWGKTVCSRKRYSHDVGPCINRDPFEHSRIQSQPQDKRRDENAFPKRIERLNVHPVAGYADVSSKRLPAELRMFDYVGCDVEGVSKEIRSVVATVRIPLQG